MSRTGNAQTGPTPDAAGPGPFYVRDAGGQVTGPFTLLQLRQQAEMARLEPDCEVSPDQHDWRPVVELAELQMIWLVERPDGSYGGPLNLQAVKRLIHAGLFSPGARTIKRSSSAAPPPAAQNDTPVGVTMELPLTPAADIEPAGDNEQLRASLIELEAELQRNGSAAEQKLARLARARDELKERAAALATQLKEQARESRKAIDSLLSKIEDLRAEQQAAREREQEHASARQRMHQELVDLAAQLQASHKKQTGAATAQRDAAAKGRAREDELTRKAEGLKQQLKLSKAESTAARKKAREVATQLRAKTAAASVEPKTTAKDKARLLDKLARQAEVIAGLKSSLEAETQARKREAALHKTALKEAGAAARALNERIRKQEVQQETTDRWIAEQRDLYKKQIAEWRAREMRLAAENQELQRHHQQALRNLEQALSMFAENE